MKSLSQNDTTPSAQTDPRIHSWLTWTFFMSLVVYPLSIAPVAKFIPDPPESLGAFYAPLGYLADHLQPVRSFYDWYAKLWGVRL
jgi:hypothetical protein